MALKLSNNASSTLAANISTGSTSLTVQSADAGKFPTLGSGDWCPLTVIDSAGNMEIMKCTARAGAVLTVSRAQEGTQAKAFTAGARVDVRLTVAAMAAFDAAMLGGKAPSYYTDIKARLGYTPLDAAGGTMTGSLLVKSGGFTNVTIESEAAGADGVLQLKSPGGTWGFYNDDDGDNELNFRFDGSIRLSLTKDGGLSLGTDRKEVWHTGNVGSGSGLDADKLDGQHGSYFTNIPARLGYAPVNKAGDSLSGPLRLENTEGGAGQADKGVLIELVNFAPALAFTDASTGSVGAALSSDTSRFILNSWDGASMTPEVTFAFFNKTLEMGDWTIQADTLEQIGNSSRIKYRYLVSPNDLVVIGTATEGSIRLRPNGGNGAFTTGEFVVSPTNVSWAGHSLWHTGNFDPSDYLGKSAKAADSNLLDGHNSTYFATASEVNNKMDLPYTGTSASNTNFPIGTYLIRASGAPARNASLSVNLNTADSAKYTSDSSGASLSGSWRSRGEDQANSGLVQRVA